MRKSLLQGLTLAGFAMVGTMGWATGAGAVTAFASCTFLTTRGASYVLVHDLHACGNCVVVANDHITVDLAGHTIIGSCGGAGITDDGTPRQSLTIKNGTIREFDFGVLLGSSERTVIRNLAVADNAAQGLILGPRSLVKGCLIERNGLDGILLSTSGQVENCTIVGKAPPAVSGGSGIFGGEHVLVTNNTVAGHLYGIVVGDFSTVSFNVSSGNAIFGVFTGRHGLVTGNATDGNGGTGIVVGGFSTVSSNRSSNNGQIGIDVGLGGLFDGTHSLITRNITQDNGRIGVTVHCPSDVTNNDSSGNGWTDYEFRDQGCRIVNNN